MRCFEAKNESTVEARIDALRIAIHSSSLYRLFVTKTLGNTDNLDFWMTEIFTDNELNDSVKAAIKINEDTWPLKQAYRQRASYLVKVFTLVDMAVIIAITCYRLTTASA